jgi:drug/metabolite transporter (DMT)-like permease
MREWTIPLRMNPLSSPTMPGTSNSLIVRSVPLIFVFFWSTGFIGAKYGMPYAEPFTFLWVRMASISAIFVLIVLIWRPRWPDRVETLHCVVVGLLMHGVYLGGAFVAIAEGVPAGVAALLPGLQPVLMATLASRWLGERVSAPQWAGLALGIVGVLLVLNDRAIFGSGSMLGWAASMASLLGITVGTMYQKKYGGKIDWRTGNLIQYVAATLVFLVCALLLETGKIEWSTQFILAMAWLVIVLSLFSVSLMYWLIRRAAAANVASLFYLVPATTAFLAWLLFDERLNTVAIIGMVLCAGAVLIVNASKKRA